ncbi:deoxyribonuclease IV [Pasteuria penetrans]|uniref:deoxyribonuclease IV n=1 Tax=Pasteuria penetrans TaxID=86005 RepID=UPI000FA33754|nr:deoxyribonuclease IV [Pasteuria penetrans]
MEAVVHRAPVEVPFVLLTVSISFSHLCNSLEWIPSMKIGCHISVGKGFLRAAQRAVSLGATSFQVFTKNPRGLRPKKLNREDAEAGRNFCQEHRLTVVTHTPYITNLSTPKDDLRSVIIRSIREDLQITDAYGGIGAVVHCGKHVGEGEEYGKQRMVDTLNAILDMDQEGSPNALLLLENTAGQGTELGTQLADLVELRAATRYPDRIGFCFDTCHGFVAGIWEGESFVGLVSTMKEVAYLPHLRVLHFNDSLTPFASRKDRHAKIGKGEIGTSALHHFLKEPAFAHLPFILETPVQDEGEYKDEISYLHALCNMPLNADLPGPEKFIGCT